MTKKFTILLILYINILTNAQFENYNTEYLISSNVQKHYSVTGLNNGNIVFAWEYSYNNLSAKIFLKNQKSFSPFSIGISGYSNYLPNLASLSNGGFVLAWESVSNHAYASIYNSSAEQLGSKITLFNSDYWWRPVKVVGLENGGFVSVWNNDQKTYYRQYDENITTIVPETKVNSFSWDQSAEAVHKFSSGGYLITWIHEGPWRADTLYGQIFNSSGEKVGNELKLLDNIGAGYDIEHLPNDNFIVTWSGLEIDDNSLGIGFQKFNEFGEKVGELIIVNDQSKFDQINPNICIFEEGGFAIFWISELVVSGEDHQIFGRLFNQQGEKIGYEFPANEIEIDDRCDLALKALADDEFIATWRSDESLYAKIYKQKETIFDFVPFNQVQPFDKITIMPSKPLFIWKSAIEESNSFYWEVMYDLYIASNLEFEDALILRNLTDTTYQLLWWLEPDNTYYWKVVAKNIINDSLSTNDVYSFYIDPNIVSTPESSINSQISFSLAQNYPNPFNPSTTIKYTVPSSTVISNLSRVSGEISPNSEISLFGRNDNIRVTLKVYDILGKEIATLVNETKQTGTYEVGFNAPELPSGIYFYKLQIYIPGLADNFIVTKNMVLLR